MSADEIIATSASRNFFFVNKIITCEWETYIVVALKVIHEVIALEWVPENFDIFSYGPDKCGKSLIGITKIRCVKYLEHQSLAPQPSSVLGRKLVQRKKTSKKSKFENKHVKQKSS